LPDDQDTGGDLAAARAALVEGRPRHAAAEDDTLCGLCGRWPRGAGREWCERCLRDLGAQLDRRRAAELRLVPLDRDPS
jgi:hypothetical protein